MSKKALVLGITCMLLIAFSGCGGKAEMAGKESAEPEGSYAPEADENSQEAGSVSGEEAQPPVKEDIPEVSVNTEEMDLRMENPQVRFASGSCAADGDRIYLSQSSDQGESAIYAVEIGGAEIEKLPVSIPEDMDVNSLAVDVYGNLYAQLSTNRKHKEENAEARHLIWRLNKEGQVEKEIDITNEEMGEYPPFYFLVDREGRIYLQWGWYHIRAWILDENGQKAQVITEESLGMDEVDLAGLDADGMIRLVCRRDGEAVIAGLDMQKGELLEAQKADFLKEGAICLALGAGTDTDILLYDNGGRIWAVDLSAGTGECRNTYLESGEGFAIITLQRAFLPDGRLLLLQTVTDNGELSAYRFRYVPGGR